MRFPSHLRGDSWSWGLRGLHCRRMFSSIPAPNAHWIPAALPSRPRRETTKGLGVAKYPLGEGVGDQISGLQTAGLEAGARQFEASSGRLPKPSAFHLPGAPESRRVLSREGGRRMCCGEREVEEERHILRRQSCPSTSSGFRSTGSPEQPLSPHGLSRKPHEGA